MILHNEFPVRPPYECGESLAGYIYRVHSVNGHRVPKATTTLIGRLYGHGRWPSDHRVWPKLEELLGRHCPFYAADWAGSWKLMWSGYIPYSVRSTFRRNRLIFCPACIEENGKHVAMWETPLVSMCLVHRCRLTASCDHCGEELQWLHLRPDWRCRCGFVLARSKREPGSLTEYMRSLAAYAASDLELPDTDEEAIRLYSVHTAEPYATVFESLYLLYGLRRLIRANQPLSKRGADPRRSSDVRGEPLGWGCHLLRQWPHSFESKLLLLAHKAGSPNRRILARLKSDSTIWRAGAIADESRFLDDKRIRQVIDVLIGRVKRPLPGDIPVLFAPSRPTHDYALRLSAFRRWWRVLNKRRSDDHAFPM